MRNHFKVRTIATGGRDWDEIDRREGETLDQLVAAGQELEGWELFQILQLPSMPVEVGGLTVQRSMIRAFFKRTA